jgi:hypothetical protein
MPFTSKFSVGKLSQILNKLGRLIYNFCMKQPNLMLQMFGNLFEVKNWFEKSCKRLNHCLHLQNLGARTKKLFNAAINFVS